MRLGIGCTVLLAACGLRGDMPTDTAIVNAQRAAEASAFADAVLPLVELAWDIDVNQGVEARLAELADVWTDEMPCADITTGATEVTINLSGDACTWAANSWTGRLTVEALEQSGERQGFTFTFTDVADGRGTLEGSTSMFWRANDTNRRIESNLSWTPTGGETYTVADDRRFEPTLLREDGTVSNVRSDGRLQFFRGDDAWSVDIQNTIKSFDEAVPFQGEWRMMDPARDSMIMLFFRDTGTQGLYASVEGTEEPIILRFDDGEPAIETSVMPPF